MCLRVCVCVCACMCAFVCDSCYFTVRKSKAADLRRRSMAKQTREDHRRRSVKALEQGRVAAMSKSFGGVKPPLPPKPKQRTVAVTTDLLSR